MSVCLNVLGDSVFAYNLNCPDLKQQHFPLNIIPVHSSDYGPSGVSALPLAPGRNEGGHYFRYIGPSEVRAPAT